jgi:hypothetical protein
MLFKLQGRLHPNIDSLEDPNGLGGVYQCKMRGGWFFLIQDKRLAPPEIPTTWANNSEWSKLCKADEKVLASFEKNAIKWTTEKISMTKMPKWNQSYWTMLTFPCKQKVHAQHNGMHELQSSSNGAKAERARLVGFWWGNQAFQSNTGQVRKTVSLWQRQIVAENY